MKKTKLIIYFSITLTLSGCGTDVCELPSVKNGVLEESNFGINDKVEGWIPSSKYKAVLSATETTSEQDSLTTCKGTMTVESTIQDLYRYAGSKKYGIDEKKIKYVPSEFWDKQKGDITYPILYGVKEYSDGNLKVTGIKYVSDHAPDTKVISLINKQADIFYKKANEAAIQAGFASIEQLNKYNSTKQRIQSTSKKISIAEAEIKRTELSVKDIKKEIELITPSYNDFKKQLKNKVTIDGNGVVEFSNLRIKKGEGSFGPVEVVGTVKNISGKFINSLFVNGVIKGDKTSEIVLKNTSIWGNLDKNESKSFTMEVYDYHMPGSSRTDNPLLPKSKNIGYWGYASKVSDQNRRYQNLNTITNPKEKLESKQTYLQKYITKLKKQKQRLSSLESNLQKLQDSIILVKKQ